MKKKVWPWVTVAVLACVVCVGAFTYSFTPLGEVFRPSLTGDRASDATCAASVAPFLENGEPEKGKLVGMTLDERRDLYTAVEKASREVQIPEIKQAADGMLGGLVLADGGPFGQIRLLSSMAGMAKACTSNGWDAKTAGLW